MGWFRDLAAGYADQARHHTGVHYVPSFNDMNSMSNDDLEEQETVSVSMHNSESKPLAMHRKAPTPYMQAAPKRTNPKSNKADDAWPAFEVVDIHKVNRSNIPTKRSHMYDIVAPGSPDQPSHHLSVWEYIVMSEELKEGGWVKSPGDINESVSA